MVACAINDLLLNAIHFTAQGRIELQVSPGRLVALIRMMIHHGASK